jgi:hypothetical protein
LNASPCQLRGPKTLVDSCRWVLNLKFTNNSMNQQGGVVGNPSLSGGNTRSAGL